MASLVSHPDEVKVISKRFGQGATEIDRYLQLDGYKAVQKALDHAARRPLSMRSKTPGCADEAALASAPA